MRITAHDTNPAMHIKQQAINFIREKCRSVCSIFLTLIFSNTWYRHLIHIGNEDILIKEKGMTIIVGLDACVCYQPILSNRICGGIFLNQCQKRSQSDWKMERSSGSLHPDP